MTRYVELAALMEQIEDAMPGCAWQINKHFPEIGTAAVYLTARSGEWTMAIGASPVEALRKAFEEHKADVRYADDFAEGVI